MSPDKDNIQLALEDCAYDVYDPYSLRTFLLFKMFVYSGIPIMRLGTIHRRYVMPQDIKILSRKNPHYASKGYRILQSIPIERFFPGIYRELWAFIFFRR